MVRLVQLLIQVEQPNSSFLVCSAWRKLKTSRISECKEKGGRFFECFSQKILPDHCIPKNSFR
ncbi:hypothetical protein FT376_09180 [Campylobacter jejuni]|nr:hypothetical protein [Campylobacter jejuni]